MFDKKQTQLFNTQTKPKAVQSEPASPFVNAALKKGAETTTGNGALAYKTTGNDFVDQFGSVGTYRAPRLFADIAKDCHLLWSQNKLSALMFFVYLRIITRKTKLSDGTVTESAQKGGELKHESIMRMLWLHVNAPEVFWKNIGVFISVGSWKDIFVMLRYDLTANGWNGRKLDWKRFAQLIISALNNEAQVGLVKKYLPSIKSNKDCTTVDAQANNMIGKWLCSELYGSKLDWTSSDPEATKYAGSTYKAYRKLKSSGTAHEWQQLISQGKFRDLDFNKIHGRALKLLVQSKFLANQNLTEEYEAWITAPETKDVKFTGFVHELFERINEANDVGKVETINKQFATLVNKAKEDGSNTKLIVVRDTSGSMCSKAEGLNMSSFDVAKALALYFSEFLDGPFANSFIEFNSNAKMHQWKGNTPVEKWRNDHCDFVGSTDFQSVIRLFIMMKRAGVAEEHFPTGILCISDGNFNPAELNYSNVETARKALFSAGFSAQYCNDFVIALWNIPNGYYGKSKPKFETFGDVKNVFYMSGYSAAIVSFLGGKIETAQDLLNAAMDQQVLKLLEV